MSIKKEYEEFYELTKPIKFRTLKLIKQYCVLWCKALRERIKYLYYNILYKLKILKRRTYRDNTEKVLPLPYPIEEKKIEAPIVKATVSCNLVEETHTDIDYFYKTTKDGVEVKKYVIADNSNTHLFLSSHLKDISVYVDRWYGVYNLPKLKVAMINRRAVPYHPKEDTIEFNRETLGYTTLTLDTYPLVKVFYKSLLGTNIEPSPTNLPRCLLQYHYDISCEELTKHLETIKLMDLTE